MRRPRRAGSAAASTRAVATFARAGAGVTEAFQAAKAAEGRAVLWKPSDRMDPRAAHMIVEVERLTIRGRHAAAERALRAAIGAFDRRGDSGRSADLALRLGRLLLSRGRAEEARAVFSGAHERFQRLRVPERAIEAMVHLGLAQTDLAQLNEAEHSCRAAYSASSALGIAETASFPAIALARVLFWQKRHADARSLLEAVVPRGDAGLCARYWCLAARLQIAVDAVADAWRAVERARPAATSLAPAIESVVCECEAAIQGRLATSRHFDSTLPVASQPLERHTCRSRPSNSGSHMSKGSAGQVDSGRREARLGTWEAFAEVRFHRC